MSKIKLNSKREEVSSEEIKSRRDFTQLMKEYKAAHQTVSKPFYKNTFFIAGTLVVLTGTILTISYFNNRNKSNEVATSGTIDSIERINQPFISAPFKNIQIPFEKFTVVAEKGGVLKTASGSIIKIPANAFAYGELLTGKIDISYREFRDPVDILVSGIPMKYDSAGIAMQLESGGMFEIQGHQNGKPLQVIKPIAVEMTSKKMEGDFNQYYLDTVSRSWKYLGRDKTKKILETSNTRVLAKDSSYVSEAVAIDDYPEEIQPSYQEKTTKLKNEIITLKKEEPVKPIKAKAQNYNFDLDVLPDEFPELTDYKGLKFEVGPENKNFSEKMYAIEWDDVKLNYNTPGKNYKITFIDNNKNYDFIVYPVYQPKDSVKVIALYQKKYKVYEKKLNERLAAEKKLEEERVAEQKRQEVERKKREEAWAKQQELQKKSDQEFMKSKADINDRNIRRMFSVEKFGIYNCDFASFYPDRIVLKASFSSDGKAIAPMVVYMLDADKNTVFMQYYNFDNFFYNPTSKHTLLTVLPDNKLAIFSSEDFKSLKELNGKYNFDMKKNEMVFSSVNELKEFLLKKTN